MNSIKILLILSILPSIVLGYIIYTKDKKEKEPKGLLVKLFLLGILAAILTVILSSILDIILPILESHENMNLIELSFYCFIKIALIEEGFKLLLTYATTWNSKVFNHIYDAIIYTVFTSLGFATIENILYVLSGGIFVALLRAILSVPGHTFFGIFMGYYYGMSKQASINNNIKLEKKNLFLSLIVPVILHGVFDYCLLSNSVLLIILYLIFVILLYIVSFTKVRQMSNITRDMIQNNIEINCSNCNKTLTGRYCSICGKDSYNK